MAVKSGHETKGYKKTKDCKVEIHDTHSRIQIIRPQRKRRYFKSRPSRKEINTL